MPLMFYPHSDDAQKGSLGDRIEVLLDAAQRYKAYVLDVPPAKPEGTESADTVVKLGTPRELGASYNWEEVAFLLREIRELTEGTPQDKVKKGNLLMKLAEVYEVLRGAKMSKLEAVRLALVNEATQLQGSGG